MLHYVNLFRWPNLLIIILTQILLKVTVFEYLLRNTGLHFPISDIWFLMLILSTVFIAIAGYIGNDIYDLEIDKINRPNRPLASGAISVSQARFLRLLFEVLGLTLGIALSIHVGNVFLASIFLLMIILMRMYSLVLKCKGLIGNLVIAFSSAMVPAIVWIFGVYSLHDLPSDFGIYMGMIHTITLFYIAFAFIFTLIREIVKDLEDLIGDRQLGCQTIAVKTPLKKLKYGLIGLNALAIQGILLFQFVLYNSNTLISKPLFIANFASIEVVILFFIIPKLITANAPLDFHKIGNTLKIIMLAGILQMLFLLF